MTNKIMDNSFKVGDIIKIRDENYGLTVANHNEKLY